MGKIGAIAASIVFEVGGRCSIVDEEVADLRNEEPSGEECLHKVASCLVAYAGQIGVIIIDSGLPSEYFRRQSL